MSILDLYQSDGNEAKRKTPLEWAGPCPQCGGSDRFNLWPENGKYWCRQCQAQGDEIQYLRDFRGLSFQEARAFLGRDNGGHHRGKPKAASQKKKAHEWTPICPILESAPKAGDHYELGKPGQVWTYRDADGQPIMYVCRWDTFPGKEIRPLCYAENQSGRREWRWAHLIEPRPLYGLDRLAARPEAPVLVVEGEKSCDTAQVLFQSATAGNNVFKQAGSLEDWQSNMAVACVGNSRLAFMMSAGFAAPLLHLIGAESGGFNLRGASSSGKTTGLTLVASVWGGPDYVRTWRATSNGLETTALSHNDTLLCLDELSQVSSREAGAVAYMLANGSGKSRMRRNTSARPVVTWRVLFISTGELSLADKMQEAGHQARAGQEIRVLDLPADAGAGLGIFEELHGLESGAAFASHLKRASNQYYGIAGRAYLERLINNMDGLSEAVTLAKEQFLERYCPAGVDGQVIRAAERFGLVAAGGTLATALGILPWPDNEALNAAGRCFEDWLNERGTAGPQEIKAGIEQVRRFFQLHGESRFQPWFSEKDRITINRAGFCRNNGSGRTEYFVFPEIFKSEICAGYDSKLIAQELISKGLLLPGTDGKVVALQRLPGFKNPRRVYHFTDRIIGEGEDD